MKKNGFTLSEVLITLVIIGVIAALTVPSLIAKYHEEQLKTQFKKTYSTITQVLSKTALIDFSGQVDCYYLVDNDGKTTKIVTSDCFNFFRAYTKNLVVSKTCLGNAYSLGCVPEYSQYTSKGGCSGFFKNGINSLANVYVLTSGQIIITYLDGSGTWPLFLVDINGIKGPNRPGYDLFGFNFRKKSKSPIYINDSYTPCAMADNGGRTTEEMMKYAFAGQ